MSKILSVSHDPLDACWQQRLLEQDGHRVVSAIDAAEASSFIRAAEVDAILLGSALGVHDRTSIALLGVTSNIPVVCMCGVRSEPGCPVIHVPPSHPAGLLAAFAQVLGQTQRRYGRAFG
jgi:DNA-binding NtrC family response regulator